MTLRRLRAGFHTLRAECAACFSLFGRVPFLHNGACAVCFAVRRFCRRNTLVFRSFSARACFRAEQKEQRGVRICFDIRFLERERKGLLFRGRRASAVPGCGSGAICVVKKEIM